jgi:hypothetical protein
VWDAVARLHGKEGQLGPLVVEAKSHALELRSTCAAQDEDSVGRINAALTETKRCLGVSDLVDWHAPHYQMANRLAFLYYLRQRSGIPAWLVFVYFTGDRFCSGEPEVIGPLSEEEWEPIIRTAHKPISTESG